MKKDLILKGLENIQENFLLHLNIGDANIVENAIKVIKATNDSKPLITEQQVRNMIFDYAQFIIKVMDGEAESMPVGVWFDRYKGNYLEGLRDL